MAASLSGYPAIAISFGLMAPYKGHLLTDEIVSGGIRESCKVMKKLFELGWGEGVNKVDVYSVNVPLQPEILQEGGASVEFTTMARTNYGRLFKSTTTSTGITSPIPAAGPGVLLDLSETTPVEVEEIDKSQLVEEHLTKPLSFIFAPDIGSLINPSPASMVNKDVFYDSFPSRD
jgi:tubulin--tyrosine ligase